MRRGTVAIAVLFLVASTGIGSAQDAGAVQPATVLRIRGTVEVRVGDRPWRRGHEREQLNPGDRIRTGADGEAILELSDRNLVRLGEGSEIGIDVALVRREVSGRVAFLSTRRNVHDFRIDQSNGDVTHVLRGLERGSSYNLRTPVATAGVRGTIFRSVVRGGGNSNTGGDATGDPGGGNSNTGGGNVGTGNQGQGLGNTGDGNQGQGLEGAGNTGGGGPTMDVLGGIAVDFQVIEGSIDVTSDVTGEAVTVPEGFSYTVSNEPVVGDAGGDEGGAGPLADAGGGEGEGGEGSTDDGATADLAPIDATTVEGIQTASGVLLQPADAGTAALLSDLQSQGILLDIQFTAPSEFGGSDGGICHQ